MDPVNRRNFIMHGAAVTGAALAGRAMPSTGASVFRPTSETRFRYCLNTSTIRGQQLDLPDQIQVASQAGYDGIEPWVRDIQQYVELGGRLKDLRRHLEDAGLRVENAIGFAPWIVDDPSRRDQAIEQLKRDMDLVRQLGGERIAAPPAGATDQRIEDLFAVADRYRTILEVGDQTGVVPQLEIWGFSKTLNRLGEAVLVAVEASHPKACLLPDVYHIYKGGSQMNGIKLLNSSAIQVFHLNDYPAEPDRGSINDSDRVFPGDGIAPIQGLIQDLDFIGFQGVLSLELFNPDYWKQDALDVAKTGLQKMQEVVAASLD